MANTKLTQKDYYNMIIEVLKEAERDDLIDFCKDRIDKLARKSSSKKPTKTQIENEGIKETILEVLADLDNAVTTSALATEPRISVSTQKLAPILKALVAFVQRKRARHCSPSPLTRTLPPSDNRLKTEY